MDRHGAEEERRTGPALPAGCEVLVELDADWPAPRRPDADEPVSRARLDEGEDLPVSRSVPGDGPLAPGGGDTAAPVPVDEHDMPVRRPLGRLDVAPPDVAPASDAPAVSKAAASAAPAHEDRPIEAPRPPMPRPPPSHVVADGPFDGQSRRPRAARATHAIVVYDGDKLRDVYDLLESLGARPERARLSGPTRFEGWDLPPKLLVVDAQDAVNLDWPQDLADGGVVRIAVASSASAVLGKILRARGFHYLVRRPLHPQALAVLLRHALHRGHDRRRQPRSPLGIDARLSTRRLGWPRACTLLELSSMACRVVTHEDVPLLTPVRLRIGRAVTGTRTILLEARVVRRRRDEQTGEWVLALRFVEVPPEQRGRLDDLLARTAIGPSTAASDPVRTPRRRWPRWLGRTGVAPSTPDGASVAPLGPARAAPLAPPSAAPPPERRRERRAALGREVVALDDGGGGVRAVLAGRDLSVRGMRVEPHPDLVVGQRRVIAFHDSVSGEALEIEAEVARDDGGHGLGIRFVDMAPRTAARLEQLVDALPSLESLQSDTGPLVTATMGRPSGGGDRSPAPGAASDSEHRPDAAGATETHPSSAPASGDPPPVMGNAIPAVARTPEEPSAPAATGGAADPHADGTAAPAPASTRSGGPTSSAADAPGIVQADPESDNARADAEPLARRRSLRRIRRRRGSR